MTEYVLAALSQPADIVLRSSIHDMLFDADRHPGTDHVHCFRTQVEIVPVAKDGATEP